MGIRGDIDENDRDLNRDMYPNRNKSNRFAMSDDELEGSLGGHLRDFYGKSSVIRKDGYGERTTEEFTADYTPKDITGSGKNFVGKGPRGYVRNSERIEADIHHRLTEHRRLDASFIEVEVVGDEVHLEGYVSRREDKWLTEDIVEEIPGVKTIINRLRVRTAS